MRIGFIGAGSIAQAHFDAVKANGADVVGCVTRGESGQVFCQQNNIPFFSHQISELIDNTSPDALFILTPSYNRKEILQQTAPYKLPIFLEKPIAYTTEKAEELQTFLSDTVFVGMNRRFYHNLQFLKRYTENINEPLLVHTVFAERRKDYADRQEELQTHWYMHNGIHLIDLITWCFGKPKQILGKNRWGISEGVNASCMNTVLYETEHGHTVNFLSNLDSPGGWRIQLMSAGGPEVITWPLEKTIVKEIGNQKVIELSKEDNDYKPGFFRQTECFLSGVKSPQNLPSDWVSFDEALESIRAVETLFFQ